MSQARIYTTQKSRKVWTCGKCRCEIPKGEKVIHFTVGYRGFEQHRCGRPECFPLPSERESSAVSSVYAAQEEAAFDSCNSAEELEEAVQAVIDACDEIVSESESNEMYEINEDLQERAETIRSAGEELESWMDSLEEEPNENDEQYQAGECGACSGTGKDEKGEPCSTCSGTGELESDDDFESDHEQWLQKAREAAREAVNSMELP